MVHIALLTRQPQYLPSLETVAVPQTRAAQFSTEYIAAIILKEMYINFYYYFHFFFFFKPDAGIVLGVRTRLET